MEHLQHIHKEGKHMALAEFVNEAIAHLNTDSIDTEVVKRASEITELEHDYLTSPDTLHPLPKGFTYRFSGFGGCVIGIVKD